MPGFTAARVARACPRSNCDAFRHRRTRARASYTARAPTPRAAVKVTFISEDGKSAPVTTTVEKPEVLRTVALDAKCELYAGVNKLLNCGGMGNCGTCGVDVLRGGEFLSERTDPEARKLSAGKLKESWRLSCQCVVDGPDGAELEVALRPKK